MSRDATTPHETHPVVFFDGECGLCHRTVAFLIERDRAGVLRFAHLQGDLARRVLPDDTRDVGRDGSVALLEEGGRVSLRSAAVLRALAYLPAPWGWLGALASVRAVRPLLNRAYEFVARRRDRWFPRSESCPLPDARLRPRFID
jgi:predicted DCC family thiol-disulfide oxidoreductase YuxK